MKLLHTSDWHIGRSLFEFSLLNDQREIFEQICSIVRSEQVDAVLISGDLYDRSLPSADAVQLLDHIFTTLTEQIGVPVLAISGNHDSGSRVSYGSRMLEKKRAVSGRRIFPPPQKGHPARLDGTGPFLFAPPTFFRSRCALPCRRKSRSNCAPPARVLLPCLPTTPTKLIPPSATSCLLTVFLSAPTPLCLYATAEKRQWAPAICAI